MANATTIGERVRLALDAFLLVRVSAEKTSGSKFAQLVTDHVLGAETVDERPSIVDLEGVPDEFGNDRAGSSPRLDGTTPTRLVHLLNLSVELLVNEWAFFQ